VGDAEMLQFRATVAAVTGPAPGCQEARGARIENGKDWPAIKSPSTLIADRGQAWSRGGRACSQALSSFPGVGEPQNPIGTWQRPKVEDPHVWVPNSPRDRGVQ
jgi:hypothetical protein